jgi:hypothetical protein
MAPGQLAPRLVGDDLLVDLQPALVAAALERLPERRRRAMLRALGSLTDAAEEVAAATEQPMRGGR